MPSALTQKKPSKGFLVVRLPRGPTGDAMAVESQGLREGKPACKLFALRRYTPHLSLFVRDALTTARHRPPQTKYISLSSLALTSLHSSG